MIENLFQEYTKCNYDCWECPDLDTCETTKEIVRTIIPFELRKFGTRLDELNILRKADIKLDNLLRLRKIECRIEHLLQLKEIDCRLDKLLSTPKNHIEKIRTIFNRIEKEFKKYGR